MKHRSIRSLILSVLAILVIALPVFAFTYSATVAVTENGTSSHVMAPVTFPVNNTFLADNGFITSSGLDTRIQTSGGQEKPHLVADNATYFAIPVPINSQTNLLYTFGESLLSAFKMVFGEGGFYTIADNASLEPGDNFSIELDGFFDTSFGDSSQQYLQKDEAFRIWNSSAGNITATVGASLSNITTTSVVTLAGGNNAINNTSHTITMPASIVINNLLIVVFTVDAAPSITFPGGWTLLYEKANGADVKQAAYYKISDGTDGATISVTTGAAQMSSHATFQIKGAGIISVGTAATGNSINPDPPSLTTTGNAVSQLWLALQGWNDGSKSQSGVPANYAGTSYRSVDVEGTGTGRATRTLNAITENPGTFTISGAREWIANTIAISPPISVTAGGLSSGEYNVLVSMDSPFLSIEVDPFSTPITPVTDNLVMNAALWQTESSVSPFTTIDSNAHVSTVTGATWTINEGYNFNGVNQYIRIADDATLDITGTVTLDVWVKETGYVGFARLIERAGGNSGYQLLSSNGKIRFTPGGTTGGALDSAFTLTLGTWYHIVAVYDGTKSYIYRNGIEDVQEPSTGAINSVSVDLGLGIRLSDLSGDFNGVIGEARVYATALSPTEVLQNYNATKNKYPGHSGGIDTYSTLSSVPDNANDCVVSEYITMPYINSENITVGGNLVSWHQPTSIINGTFLPDRAIGNSGNITWGSNPLGVAVLLGEIVSFTQPSPGETIADETIDILPPISTSDWFQEPDITGSLSTNPLRPFVQILSNTTTMTELQAWRLLGLAMVLMVTVVTAFKVGEHQLITGIVAGAAIGGMVALTIFPFWSLAFIVVTVLGGVVAERSPSL